MIDLTMAVVFGTPGNAVGWATQHQSDEVPLLGVRAAFRVTSEDNEETPGEILAQVMFSDFVDEGTVLAYLYGGPALPSGEFVSWLEAASWTPMDQEDVEEVLGVCSAAPPLAAVHSVLLLAGEPEGEDFQAWSRVVSPRDPVLPVFGQRMLIDSVEGMGQDEDIDVTAPDSSGEQAEPDPLDVGSMAEGLPAITVFSGLASPGYAEIVFWTSGLGDVGGFDLMAAGWQQLSVPEQFDPVAFRAKQRINLALATRLVWREEEDGQEYLHDLEMDDPEKVSPEDYDLLPPALASYCLARKEIADLPDRLAEWEQDPGTEA